MGKSRKKQPWVKDKKPRSNFYNKVFRRTNKILINKGEEPIASKSLVNQYDVCDYKFMIEEDSKYMYK